MRIPLLSTVLSFCLFSFANADFEPLVEQRFPPQILLAINEFMASNNNCIQDPQGQCDDWIEIYNSGVDAVDIGGMYLTDNLSDPVKWQIPVNDPALTTIEPDGHLLIWADGDISDPGLHANFKLDADGEEIGLFKSDGITMIDSVVFGEQTGDISYGRYPDGTDNWRFFGSPSPAAENIGVYEGFVAEVQFSRDSGLYDEPFSVTLATETEDTIIYYTLDGSEPYELGSRFRKGTVYRGPISVNRTTYLKAVAIKTGWKPSDAVMQAYIILDLSVSDFSSNLPIAVVDTMGKGISQTAQTLSFASFIDITTDGRTRLTDPPDFTGRAGINIRGKSSAGFAKKQYHFETWDQYDQDKDVSILGFPADSDWILQGPYSDKSLMRNFLTYQWSNDLGRYAVRTRYIEMFLNTDGGGVSSSDYIGVYILMEKIKRGADRVDIAELQPSDNAEPQISGGYIVKKDKLDGGEPTFNTSRGLTLIYVEPKPEDITETQRDWIRNYLNQFEAALYGSNFRDPLNGYAGYIDVGSFIDVHILVELTKNIDGFRLSTYMFKDRSGKLNMGPAWDYNLSLGNADYLQGWIPTGWYYPQLGDGDYPWWRRLFEDSAFGLRYADRWFELRENLFATDRLLRDIYDTAALLNEAQARNFDRWRILGSYVWPNWYIAGTYDEEINWMSGWLEQRLDWMDSQIAYEFAAAPPGFSPQDGQFDQPFELAMTAPYGQIYYTLDGMDPAELMPSEGIKGMLVPENAEKRVFVPVRQIAYNWNNPSGFNDRNWYKHSDSPGGVGYERESGYDQFIGLNMDSQMYARNASCFIRIPFSLNDSPNEFDILTLNIRYDDGFVAYLNGIEVARRNVGEPLTWNSAAVAEHPDSEAVQFESIDISASLNQLGAGSNLLAIQGLNISTTDTDFLISVEMHARSEGSDDMDLPGVSQYTAPVTLTRSTHVKARILNGGVWSAMNEAVFAIGKVAQNLRITEMMYNPRASNEEFIELKNIGAETINLNLVSFTNGIDFTFPGIDLAPGEYIVVVQDRNAFEARYGSNINIAGQYSGRLNDAGERITLADAIGRAILDFRYEDDWHSITDGEGFSLTIIDPTHFDLGSWNAKEAWRASAYLDGSPGQDDSGILPNPGAVVINEVLAHAHADASDWIELYNTTGTAIDIGGWFLSDSKDALFKYEIAAGTIIGPYDYLVFYEDLHFGNSNDAGSHISFAMSENGEGLYLSSAHNGILTGYRIIEDFGASETGVSFGRHYKNSTDNYNFVAMEQNTPGSANAYPKVGPIVISEIMYNPDWPNGSPYPNDQYEYVELQNISAEPVTLYDYETAEPWKFTDGIEFIFPVDVPVTIPAGGYLLLARKPAAFSWRYPDVPAEIILGPYDGSLSNSGERLELSMPGDVDKEGVRHYIRIDRATYSDGSHPENCPGWTDLWPIESDGQGASLTRKIANDYGNDPDNWISAPPSPGQ
ncbi:MAG TPA: lamin tail domain-containing protein [Sedimentisphaerales bacterium]|nr:lamin tail domain-containing protein [Sedimentisphaerales bacterium]